MTANTDSFNVSVLRGQRTEGVFTFADQIPIDVDAKPNAVAVADINNDGCPDILTANPLARDNATIANNVTVLLGQVDAANNCATFTRLDQKFGVGEEPVSLAIGNLNGDAFPDLVTANNTSNDVSILLGRDGGTFEAHPQSPFSVGREPNQVIIADLNADGSLDLATANGTTDNVSVLLGQGDGSFLVEQGFGVGDNPSSLTVADVNRDGNPDLITADQFSNTVSGLLGNGDGTFPAAQGFGVGELPQAVDADDLDGDNQLNLVTANAASNYVSVLFGRSQSTFVTELKAPLSAENATDAFGPRDVVIADLENGDAILDLVTANAGSEINPSTTVSVLFGQRDMDTFDATSIPLDMMRQGAVAVGDLNKDTLPDLVSASFGTDDEPANLVYVLLARGSGDYAAPSPPTIQVGTGPQDVELADLDGNGSLDVVTANASANHVSVLLGQNNGRFTPAEPRDIAVGQRPVAVAIEDLNDDGFLDLVTANTDDHNVSILLGQGDGTFTPADPPEVAVGISPSDVAVADLESMLDAGCAPGLYIITANTDSNDIAVLQIQGDADNVTVSAPQLFLAGNRPSSVKIADFNADGRPDLIAANRDSDNVSVLLQRESEDGACVFTP
ncbi:FG-GAP repeat domain-containing protein [Candidatus Entotheonella palauensis]|uniref:FG-GAP repeat domain-containing protein n=1 Tax=Candidatus Entotheonella palauensis TaxID=93172 RepID=UPI000B7F5193|nr:VCBS repeat-containing protein [Candidatus Entotheonella palauensis]